MLTILADALLTASRQKTGQDRRKDSFWEGRFLPEDRRSEYERRRARFNPYRDLW